MKPNGLWTTFTYNTACHAGLESKATVAAALKDFPKESIMNHTWKQNKLET